MKTYDLATSHIDIAYENDCLYVLKQLLCLWARFINKRFYAFKAH